MPNSLQVDTQSLIPAKQPYPPGAGSAPEAVIKQGGPSARELADALRNHDAWLKKLQNTLQNQSPVVDKIAVVDSTGKVIAAIGDFIFNGVPSTNYFSEIHVGDPLNTGDPSQALFNANPDGSVTIGQHGWLEVLDPYGDDAAWIGTQYDVFPVTGAVAGAASGTVNLIRLTATGHTLLTGDVVEVREVVGVTSATDGTSNANGTWTVTKIDANHVDLQQSVFVGTYTSGGMIWRLLHVTGAVNNGSGLIRLTVTAHAYESGDKVNIVAVGGVANATGQWIIDVFDANHFDLVGSTFAGTYTSGGTSLRYFAGGLFQTIAIGESFVNYTLRAFADGTLKIRNAEIILEGTGAIITLDPVIGEIIIDGSVSSGLVTTISAGGINMHTSSGPSLVADLTCTLIDCGSPTAAQGYFKFDSAAGSGDASLLIATNSGNADLTYLDDGQVRVSSDIVTTYSQFRARSFVTGSLSLTVISADSDAIGFDVDYESSTWTARDTSIGMIGKFSDKLEFIGSTGNTVGTGAGLTVRAVMDLSSGDFGFGGNTTPGYPVDITGDCNVSGVYRKGGTAGIGATRNFGTSVSVGSVGNGVFGTPGVGQVNGTVVTSVALNTSANTFSGGILTA